MSFIRTPRELSLPEVPTRGDEQDPRAMRRWRTAHTEAVRGLARAVRGDLEQGGFRLEFGTPASATAPGDKGSVKFDSNYLYVCVANNTWKRVALSTWP